MHAGMVQASMTASEEQLDRDYTSMKQHEACGPGTARKHPCQVCIW